MRLGEVVAALERLYRPSLAEPWDAVGLVCGDPDAVVRRVLFAVDPVEAVAREAVDGGFDLLVTHHPLYLRGTTSVAATDPKGRVVQTLITGGCALHVAHTNADSADPGVSDALADLFGLTGTVPLDPRAADPTERLVVFVPVPDADRLLDALSAAGAGAQGHYERAAFLGRGTGTFRPLPGADPAIGQVGRVEQVDEVRLELLMPAERRKAVLHALLATHPYEAVAYEVTPQLAAAGRCGLGRVGDLPGPTTLRALTARAASVLPATAWGVRAAGDPDLVVERLAVCGGAGDALLAAAAASGAQAFLTSDLRHHPASEAPVGLALLDAAHWATEWPWLHVAADRLRSATSTATPTGAPGAAVGSHGRAPGTATGAVLHTAVSAIRTDPWTLHEDAT